MEGQVIQLNITGIKPKPPVKRENGLISVHHRKGPPGHMVVVHPGEPPTGKGLPQTGTAKISLYIKGVDFAMAPRGEGADAVGNITALVHGQLHPNSMGVVKHIGLSLRKGTFSEKR
jgi:hypothetical protein